MRRKHKTSFIVKLLIGVFAVYAAVTITSQQLEINEREQRIGELKEQTQGQKIANAELKEMIEDSGTEEFYAQIARDKLGYVQRKERVFVDISSM